jgi:hypothetical protein
VTVVDQGIASISNFVPILALARWSTAYELGIYSLLFTIFVFATGCEHALITAPYTFYRDDPAINGTACYDGSVMIHHAVFIAGTSALLFLTGAATYHRGYGVPIIFAAVVASGSVLSREFIRRFCFAGTHSGFCTLRG